MPTKTNPKIALIGLFVLLNDEEYIARSFEQIGCEVMRISKTFPPMQIIERIKNFNADIILYNKWNITREQMPLIQMLRREGKKTVCWLFDLYFDYAREYLVKNMWYFGSEYVFTTDGGHQDRFDELGINHKCLRQGIYRDECILLPFEKPEHKIIFVGSDSPIYPERSRIIRELKVEWFGRKNTNEIRGMELNKLYAKTKIVIGDSFYSPYYWSNRVVETLGRGGFLIHQEVEGLKEAYPYLVTYKRGDIDDLKSKISYYLSHEDERREIVIKNFNWVKEHYTMDKMCAKLLENL
jgi:spore maturation protein CgeB